MCEVIVAAEAELGHEARLEAAKEELLKGFPDYSIRDVFEIPLPQRKCSGAFGYSILTTYGQHKIEYTTHYPGVVRGRSSRASG